MLASFTFERLWSLLTANENRSCDRCLHWLRAKHQLEVDRMDNIDPDWGDIHAYIALQKRVIRATPFAL
jgi:hypothetical protein